jgi:hypothetical protein
VDDIIARFDFTKTGIGAGSATGVVGPALVSAISDDDDDDGGDGGGGGAAAATFGRSPTGVRPSLSML